MRWALVLAVARKDLTAIRRSRSVIVPMILVPLLLLVVLPAGVCLLLQVEAFEQASVQDLAQMLQAVPPGLAGELAGMTPAQQFLTVLLGYAFGPLFLVLPLMMSSLVAADSFAGEKERGTLEALLYTPTSDLELFVGKCAGAWSLAVAVSVLGFLGYCTAGDLAGWPIMGRLFLPNPTWWLLAFWVAPAAAGTGLAVTVIISARARTMQDATQLSGMLVLPVVLLVLGQVSGVLWLSPWLVFVLGGVLWGTFALTARLGARAFRRSEVMARK